MKYFIALLFLIGSAKGQVMVGQGLTIDHSRDIHLSLDTPWLLSHGWKLVDSVKWKPYYQKKKHHPHNTVPIPNGTSFFPYPDGDTAWFMDYQKRHPEKFSKDILNRTFGGRTLITKDGIKLGGALQVDTTINGYGMTGSTPTWKAINFDSFYLSAHGLIPKYKDSIYSIKGYNWDFWQTPVEAYPWWKKALWMVFGQLTMLITYLIIIKYPRHFTP